MEAGRNRPKSARGASNPEDAWQFYIIEVNPNPHLDLQAELAMAANRIGLGYSDLIERIIELALEQAGRRP